MRKFLTAGILLTFMASIAAANHSPIDETLETKITVSDDNEYRYYFEEDKVGFPAAYTREEVNGEVKERAIYENTSVEKWVAMQANDAAADEIRDILEENLDTDKADFSVGVTGSEGHEFSVKVSEIVHGEDAEAEYSQEEIEEELPNEVSVVVNYEDRTDTAVLPVEVGEVSEVSHLASGDNTESFDDKQLDKAAGGVDKTSEERGLLSRIIHAVANLLPF